MWLVLFYRWFHLIAVADNIMFVVLPMLYVAVRIAGTLSGGRINLDEFSVTSFDTSYLCHVQIGHVFSRTSTSHAFILYTVLLVLVAYLKASCLFVVIVQVFRCLSWQGSGFSFRSPKLATLKIYT
jgi:hypothetical protein